MNRLSRRDFLKLSASTMASLAFSPSLPGLGSFVDAEQVRVATNSISVYSEPDDQSLIVRQHFRDDLLHIYKEIDAGAPAYNPIWYRVWGGYIHRGRVQKVKTIFNKPLDNFPDESRQPAELTVPYSQAMRYSKAYGWQPNLRLYYGSVHWIDGMDEGPDGEPWYQVYDELIGIHYHIQAIHLRPIPFEEWSPISPEIALEDKRIEVDLGTQTMKAYEYDQMVFQTNISSGITTVKQNPNDLSTKTPTGEFRIITKYPSKHMGNGSLFATTDDYELPGVPWTTFFHAAGYAFHGTYWHDNYGTPMSRGCVNMRIEEAKWLFRWVRPLHEPERIYTPGYGTLVVITP
ncbi:MAG TPA: L,D-transpeptidase family protein [Anaerolineales bacterium]|nr:L,D-transpeptidase family protein [Anaerolineales bacterium]